MQVFLTTRLLKAAIECVAKNDIRYYLNTVCLDFDDKRVTFAGTDGHAMFVGKDDIGGVCEFFGDEEQRRILVPRETVVAALKGYKSISITLEKFSDDRYALGDILFKKVAGKYPDYNKLLPTAPFEESIATYNPVILTKVMKAVSIAGGDTYPNLYQNGHEGKASIVQGSSYDYIGLIMPLNTKDKAPMKAWVK